ncbi:MAG TPA: U32 family peptidase [Methanomassiliicoccales archaeon]
MELLAPVGYKDALKAAIIGGADAVYLGGKDFGARRLAENFDDGEMRSAIKLAHDHHVKVYVTVNTLIKESELETAASYVDMLRSINADAVIVQDRGLLRLIKESIKMPVHASTQMGIDSIEGALWAQEEGIERVILARELSLAQIRKIKEGSKVGLEVFVHGALCYCVSGQCLFSSMLGGRSGNRGLCAQPCRKEYELGDERGYLLSTADTFGIEAIPELLRIGVKSIKIEGRMRNPLYVYVATKIYKSVIKRAQAGDRELITPRERELLETVFNRGFSRGYLMDTNVMAREYADSRGLPLGKAVSDGTRLALKTDKVLPGDGITMYRGSEKLAGFEVKEQSSTRDGTVYLRSPFKMEVGEFTVYKTKDREFDSMRKMIDTMQFPELTATRRPVQLRPAKHRRQPRQAEMSVYASSLKVLEKVLPFSDRIYFERNKQIDEARAMCTDAGQEFVPIMPRVSVEMPLLEDSSIMVCNVGQAHQYGDRRLYGHHSMNFFNSMTIPRLFQQTMSVELSHDDIWETVQHYDGRLEVLAFGRVELMITKDPSLKEGFLMDHLGKRFQVYRDTDGYAHITNSSDLFLLDYLQEMEDMGIDSFALDLRRRHPDLAELAAKVFQGRDLDSKAVLRKKCGPITSAHYQNGVP